MSEGRLGIPSVSFVGLMWLFGLVACGGSESGGADNIVAFSSTNSSENIDLLIPPDLAEAPNYEEKDGPLGDMTWHHHGHFTPAPGAVSLVDHVDGGSIFYDDRVSTRGRMLVTSLDPFYHHGSHFMPTTTRFLDGFLPWLHSEFDEHSSVSFSS